MRSVNLLCSCSSSRFVVRRVLILNNTLGETSFAHYNFSSYALHVILHMVTHASRSLTTPFSLSIEVHAASHTHPTLSLSYFCQQTLLPRWPTRPLIPLDTVYLTSAQLRCQAVKDIFSPISGRAGHDASCGGNHERATYFRTTSETKVVMG